jgi:hypothetical protein
MSKMQNLQLALSRSSGKPPPAQEPVVSTVTAPVAIAIAQCEAQGRQVNISAWLHPDFKPRLRLVQTRKGQNATLQDLMS